MDIKTRINELSEAEAKAALLFIVKFEGLFYYSLQKVLPKDEGKTIEAFETDVLDEALKEARK